MLGVTIDCMCDYRFFSFCQNVIYYCTALSAVFNWIFLRFISFHYYYYYLLCWCWTWSVGVPGWSLVNLLIRGMPGCCPRQVVGGEECWQGWAGGSFWTLGVSILCRLPLQCQIFLLSLPSVGMRQGLLWHSHCLELHVYPSWESLLWCYRDASRNCSTSSSFSWSEVSA